MWRLDTLTIVIAALIFGCVFGSVETNKTTMSKLEDVNTRLYTMEREIEKQKETPKEEKTIVISINCVSPNQVGAISEPDFYLTDAEVNELATLVMAEAEGESELGKRLVIDTVLNRMDSSHFPETVHSVIHQPGQFSCIWNGRYNRCYPKEEIIGLVNEELYDRANEDVIFFTAHHYGQYGSPLLSEGHHYFCSYG